MKMCVYCTRTMGNSAGRIDIDNHGFGTGKYDVDKQDK